MRSPAVIAAYATLTLALGGQWIAAKLGTTAVPALELSAMRFVIAAGVLLVACAVTRTPLPLARWRPNLTIAAIVLRKESVLGYTTLMVTIGAVLLAPIGALEGGYRDLGSWSTGTWLAAGFLGVFSTAVAFVLFFWAVHRFGASLAAMVAYLTPVTTLVLAFFILAERPLPVQLAGAAVIVVGVRLAARRPGAPARPAPTP